MNWRFNNVDLDRERRRQTKAPPSVGKKELRKFLGGCSREDLVEQVLQLFTDFEPVRQYYQMRLRPQDDETTTRAKYKLIIDNEFYPSRGEPGLRFSVVRKAVNDYKKVAPSEEAVADLMLHAVETAVALANDVGLDIGSFYTSTANAYGDALEWITKHGLESRFADRCERIVERSQGFGWGFTDDMDDLYDQYLGGEGDESE